MTILVDTSAVYAMIDADDRFSRDAIRTWQGFERRGEMLVSTNYVLLETYALLQARLGTRAVVTLHNLVRPSLRVIWVEQELHGAAVTLMLQDGRRRVSLVDHTSFEVMRREGIRQVFAFDRHFAEAGFDVLP